MKELGLLSGLEVTEPKLPEVFDYDASVIKLQNLRDKTGAGFKKLMQELWIARECLAVITGRPRKVQSKGPKARSWAEYLEEVGLARSTAHKWLTMFFPDRDRKISLPTKRAPTLPPNSSTSEPVMTPKDAAAGLKDQALGNAMEKPEWSGDDEDQESRHDSRSHVNENETPLSPAQLDALIRERLTVLKLKINRHADAEKVRTAQKLLSELFILFSAE